MPKGHWPGRNWTPEQVDALESGIEAGLSDAQIGGRIGRTANAVNIYRKRHGLASRSVTTLNTRKVAAILGIGCAKTVSGWIEDGYLSGHRGPKRGGNRQWVISEDALLRFLEAPEHWHRWEPSRITDRLLREWALELPRPRYLSQREVAARFHVGTSTVGQWLDKGELPFVRNGNRMVPETALEGWTPPYDRPRRYPVRVELLCAFCDRWCRGYRGLKQHQRYSHRDLAVAS